MIRPCTNDDFDAIHDIINDAAEAYRGVIPADCWHTPYMSTDELNAELMAGVIFSGEDDGNALRGVMGRQDIADVTLIRHAYVRTEEQGKGIGGELLEAVKPETSCPLLIGTWAAATWAISFYEAHGFRLVEPEKKDTLLSTYWSVSSRQSDTSVVLADEMWWKLTGEGS